MSVQDDDIFFKKRGTISILSELSKGAISIEEAQCNLWVLLGVSKSIVCKLDRMPKECSIYFNISNDCKSCGHYRNFKKENK